MSKAELRSALRRVNKQRKTSLWKGPIIDGVTQSMLNRFIICNERFRIKYVLGLVAPDEFKHQMEYGQMWHGCEEEYDRTKGVDDNWGRALLQYTKELCVKYRLQQEMIVKWYNVCKLQFPIYLKYWEQQPKSRKKIKRIMSEEVFEVPYKLPSGRIVLLRGKFDGVSLVGTGRSAGIYLDEHKTKGDIKEEQVQTQLGFDLQTMLYVVALQILFKTDSRYNKEQRPVQGVLYNVVRRPLSGGKGSIRQHKPTKSNPQGESLEEYYARLAGIIAEDPGHYFMRWQVDLTQNDIDKFEKTYLIPQLERLCDWWEWIEADPFNPFREGNQIHFRTPFGIYNILAEGGSTEVDGYLATESKVGLIQSKKLFRELE